MKNHKLCLCALAALLLLLLMAGSAMASSGTFGVIYGTDTLNLRAPVCICQQSKQRHAQHGQCAHIVPAAPGIEPL